MSKHWPLPECFRIRLTMDSDWHVGSGMGRPGIVDRLTVRDTDDLPFVPAKTLRGVWRDACERLCRGLDDGRRGDWTRWLDMLFGSQPALGPNDPTGRHNDPAQLPQESAVQIRSARIPSPLREQLIHSDRRLRQVLTFVKPGVGIDRRSGAARTDFLRFEEVARQGMILEAECRLQVARACREPTSALLIASAKLVERLGGKRRRGPGRCRLEILGADTDAAIAWLEQTASPPAWVPFEEGETACGVRYVATSGDPWLYIPLVLHLHGPLAVSYRTIGNVVETLDYLPGSYLLPHITRALSGLGVDVRAAVQAGDICVLPATPAVDGERGLPVPLALFEPKGQKGLEEPQKVVNRLLQAEPPDGRQFKQIREGFVARRPTTVYRTPVTVRTHNTVEDPWQRPTRDVGGVYTYEAIAPLDQGQPVRLCSELRIHKSLAGRLGERAWRKLSGEIALGRSKKDDYGAVVVEAAPVRDWTSPGDAPASELVVWLVSDTLIRNARLQAEPTAAGLGEVLSRSLGVRLRLRSSQDGKLDELVRIRRLDTWHVGWGLPRPSLVALQAGSCMVFRVDGEINLARLHHVEAGGIGERTAEGYGQLCFNHPLLTKVPAEWPAVAAVDRERGVSVACNRMKSGDSGFVFARLLERECWKQEIRRASLAIAGDTARRQQLLRWSLGKERGQPPMSQLGALRAQLARLDSSEAAAVILAWLEHLANNPRRKDRWPNGAIARVRDFLTDPQRMWVELNPNDWPTLTPGAGSRLRQELWPLAVRTFFDACIRAHKRELEVAHGT